MKIDKGIPIPKVERKPIVQKRLDIFEKMEINDSILFKNSGDAYNFTATVNRFYGNGCTAMRILDEGWRVWKVKEGEL